MNHCYDCNNFDKVGLVPICSLGKKNYTPKAKNCKEGITKGRVKK